MALDEKILFKGTNIYDCVQFGVMIEFKETVGPQQEYTLHRVP